MAFYTGWLNFIKSLNLYSIAKLMLFYAFTAAAATLSLLLVTMVVLSATQYAINNRATLKYTTTTVPKTTKFKHTERWTYPSRRTTTTTTTSTSTTSTPSTELPPKSWSESVKQCNKRLPSPTSQKEESSLQKRIQASNANHCSWVWLGFRANPNKRYTTMTIASQGKGKTHTYGSFAAEERGEGSGGQYPEKIGEPHDGADVYILSNTDGEYKVQKKFAYKSDEQFDNPLLLLTKRQGDICETDAYHCVYVLNDNKKDNILNRIKNAEFEDRGRRGLFLFDNYHSYPDKKILEMKVENEVPANNYLAMAVSIQHNYYYVSDPNKFKSSKPNHWAINDPEHDCVAMEVETGKVYTKSCDTDTACPYCE